MTHGEAVKAAAMRVPVVCNHPMEGPIKYNRIAAVVWHYSSGDEIKAGKQEKYVQLQLEQKNREKTSVQSFPPEWVEVDNQAFWEIQREMAEDPEPVQDKPTEKKQKRSVFCRPSFGDVAAYCADMLYEIDVQAFMDHYDACGWVVGKNKPMKDWRAAVRNWARRQGEFSAGEKKSAEGPGGSFDTDEFWDAAVRNSYGGDI